MFQGVVQVWENVVFLFLKMTKTRKVALIIFFSLFSVGIVFLLVLSKQQKKQPVSPRIHVGKPAIPTYIRGQLPITLDLNEEDVSLEKELPLLKAVFRKFSE